MVVQRLSLFVVAVGLIASAFTTFVGAKAMINKSTVVAIFLTIFFQGGLFLIGHWLAAPRPQPRKMALLWLTWLLFLSFSAYASAVGMVHTQMAWLKRAHDQPEVSRLWYRAFTDFNQFKTRARSVLVSRKEEISKEMGREKVVRREAPAKRRKPPSIKLKELEAESKTITAAERAVRSLTFDTAQPDDPQQAMEKIREAHARISDTYGAIPQELHAQISRPELPEEVEFHDNPQFALINGVGRLEPLYLTIAFIAILLDALPLLSLLSTAPRVTCAERIRRWRRWWRDVKAAWRERHNAEAIMVGIRFNGHSALSGIIRVYRGALVEDIRREMTALINTIERGNGLPVAIIGLTNVFGQKLSDSLPLLEQLGDQRVILVSYILAREV